jgi:hypothetical protein
MLVKPLLYNKTDKWGGRENSTGWGRDGCRKLQTFNVVIIEVDGEDASSLRKFVLEASLARMLMYSYVHTFLFICVQNSV